VKSGRQKGDQEALQGVDDHVRRMLCAGAEMEYRKNLRERIDGQPEPDHLCGAAQPGSQLIQLEMWEPEVAEGALVQGLCVQGLRESARWRWCLAGSRRRARQRKDPALRRAPSAPSRLGAIVVLNHNYRYYSSPSGNKGSALRCFPLKNVSTFFLFVIGASPSRSLAIS